MDIVAEQHLDAVSNMIDELFKGIKINDQEILMKRQDNTEIFTSFFIVHPYETVKKNYFVIIAKDITGQKETERKILNAVIETQERERKTFAENLHDELGPFLSGIKFYVEEITHDEPTTQKKELVEYLKKMTDQAISNTRSISNQLMPNVLVNYGLYKAINTFCEHLQIVNKISIELSSNKPGKQYDKKIELTLYRVIIELINNTLKHANATIVKISFIDNENQLTISYEDNGKGFDFENYIIGGKGLGIQNIISRIKLLKGELHFKSKPGKGFNINIQLNV
jgi:signal transduction histidine kinase